MATKKDALAAMRQLRGTLKENATENSWIVFLKAPDGRVWSDARTHQKSIFEDITDDKGTFWDLVLSEIEDLGLAVPCNEHSCEHWDTEREVCGHWEDVHETAQEYQ